ncbi:MAG: hypothetical protein WD354_07490, partial [Acidimicrobiia bacterium]
RIAESGLLHGPTVSTGDRTFQAGDRAMCLKNRSRLGVLNGDLATVTAVDMERRMVTLRLDRTDNVVTVPHWYIDEGNLDWGYALTGHKAQGATARRAHTVAGDGVDREWLYVTMSRGREANTIYLTDPDLNESECTHLTHQHPERMPALITALGRTATEPAASDSGRGPRTITDGQLNERLAALEAQLEQRGATKPVDDRDDLLASYIALHLETRARHRDRLDAIAYEPPGWIVDVIGERPTEFDRRAAWDRIVDHAVSYRAEHAVADQASGLLGPQPEGDSTAERVAWAIAKRKVERGVSRLNLEDRNVESAGGMSLR